MSRQQPDASAAGQRRVLVGVRIRPKRMPTAAAMMGPCTAALSEQYDATCLFPTNTGSSGAVWSSSHMEDDAVATGSSQPTVTIVRPAGCRDAPEGGAAGRAGGAAAHAPPISGGFSLPTYSMSSSAHSALLLPHPFAFDAVFDDTEPQEAIFSQFVEEPLVQSLDEGTNLTVMAYGQTGGGKTHSIVGEFPSPSASATSKVACGPGHVDFSSSSVPLPSGAGLLARVLHCVCHAVQCSRQTTSSTTTTIPRFHIVLSAVEVYNETVRDLLFNFPVAAGSGGHRGEPSRVSTRAAHPPPPVFSTAAGHDVSPAASLGGLLQCREVDDDVHLHGLTTVPITQAGGDSFRAGLHVFAHALGNRAVGSTHMNERSSRSHALFTVDVLEAVRQPPLPCSTTAAVSKGSTSPDSRWCRIVLLDLAGSERVKRSGVSGPALQEAVCVNKSLTALSNVVHQLAARGDGMAASGGGVIVDACTRGQLVASQHIPFRDTKLTRLLRPALCHSRSRMILLVNVSPAASSYAETLMALRFADRAKSLVVPDDVFSQGKRAAQSASLEQTLLRMQYDVDCLAADVRLASLTASPDDDHASEAAQRRIVPGSEPRGHPPLPSVSAGVAATGRRQRVAPSRDAFNGICRRLIGEANHREGQRKAVFDEAVAKEAALLVDEERRRRRLSTDDTANPFKEDKPSRERAIVQAALALLCHQNNQLQEELVAYGSILSETNSFSDLIQWAAEQHHTQGRNGRGGPRLPSPAELTGLADPKSRADAGRAPQPAPTIDFAAVATSDPAPSRSRVLDAVDKALRATRHVDGSGTHHQAALKMLKASRRELAERQRHLVEVDRCLDEQVRMARTESLQQQHALSAACRQADDVTGRLFVQSVLPYLDARWWWLSVQCFGCGPEPYGGAIPLLSCESEVGSHLRATAGEMGVDDNDDRLGTTIADCFRGSLVAAEEPRPSTRGTVLSWPEIRGAASRSPIWDAASSPVSQGGEMPSSSRATSPPMALVPAPQPTIATVKSDSDSTPVESGGAGLTAVTTAAKLDCFLPAIGGRPMDDEVGGRRVEGPTDETHLSDSDDDLPLSSSTEQRLGWMKPFAVACLTAAVSGEDPAVAAALFRDRLDKCPIDVEVVSRVINIARTDPAGRVVSPSQVHATLQSTCVDGAGGRPSDGAAPLIVRRCAAAVSVVGFERFASWMTGDIDEAERPERDADEGSEWISRMISRMEAAPPEGRLEQKHTFGVIDAVARRADLACYHGGPHPHPRVARPPLPGDGHDDDGISPPPALRSQRMQTCRAVCGVLADAIGGHFGGAPNGDRPIMVSTVDIAGLLSP